MIYYDDKKLQHMFRDLSPEHRLKAFRSAFRRQANKVRKVAVNNVRASLRSDRDLERGVRALVFKRKAAGFRVTVGTKRNKKSGKEYGMHTNRQGLKKPVLIWADKGPKWRKTNKGKRSRGFMRRYGFIQKTKEDVEGSVTEELRREIIESVHKIAEKYGCS